ncbi:hypothetical protein N0V90_001075 [Kalmusia sp. IMI 367209]|nr:hypothetical protein N0V90_001075 [Kalmusia sp. IMI 367209]
MRKAAAGIVTRAPVLTSVGSTASSFITDTDPEFEPPSPPIPLDKSPERTTISDDRSSGSNLEARNLAALKDRNASTKPTPPTLEPWMVQEKEGRFQTFTQKPQMSASMMQQRFGQPRFDESLPLHALHSEVIKTSKEPFQNAATRDRSSADPHNATIDFMGNHDWVDSLESIDPDSRLPKGIETLEQRIADMQTELRKLKMQEVKHLSKQYQVLYRLDGTCYFDHPEWAQRQKSIVSRIPVKNFDLFLERNKNIVFIVFRDFKSKLMKTRTKNTLSPPKHMSESIYLVDRQLRRALEALLKQDWRYQSSVQFISRTGEFKAPYLFIYHNRRYWNKMLTRCSETVRGHLDLLAMYVSDTYGDEYIAADILFAKRKVSAGLIKYLFQPGDILLSRSAGQYRGLAANSWPGEAKTAATEATPKFRKIKELGSEFGQSVFEPSNLELVESDLDTSDTEDDDMSSTSLDPSGAYGQDVSMHHAHDLHSWGVKNAQDHETSTSAQTLSKEIQIRVWKWSFDGDFKREADNIILRLTHNTANASMETEEWSMHDLDIYPLKFAPQLLVDELRHRGQMFWKSRKRCLVSYHQTIAKAKDESDERFMIDFHTFRKLHPDNMGHSIVKPVETMSTKEMDQDKPPDEAFLYLVPLQTKGFNLRTKKWLDLNVDQIHPVVWNQGAFDSLVLDRKTKELITALVSKQISSAKSTDVIAGKGNGLILLLHGGPGTGKTLTAEGVAEIAKKPLYRVTCGDVGTKAEEVEKYLESVLHLGKIWDCVVLLDEAEVFLERRSLDDLQRNALVSVFLRVIEYHEGILILTSNRVGTFDEAFRSRIQIAIHYPPLRAFQRLQIWKNFFDRLESFKDGAVDVDDLRDHLEELQDIEINGRQIRNAITTARQYAEWKGTVMNYEHLETALEVAGKFDKYSEKLRGGLTDDQIAEEEGIR